MVAKGEVRQRRVTAIVFPCLPQLIPFAGLN